MGTLRVSSQSKQAVLIVQTLKLSGVVVDPTSYAVATAWLTEGVVPSGGTTWNAADWETIGTALWAIRTIIGPGAVVIAASATPYVPYAKITIPSTETIIMPSTDLLEVY